MNTNNLNWLLNWHLKITRQNKKIGNWIQINTLDNPGWYFQTSLAGTGLENSRFDKIKIDRDENDWVYCYIKNGFFESPCGPLNLIEALQIFRDTDWINCYKRNDIFEGRCSVQNLNHMLEIFRDWAEAAQESE